MMENTTTYENAVKLKSLGLRESTTKSAALISASQGYFKATAVLAMAGATVFSAGAAPLIGIAALSAGAMIGNVLKKKFNPNENSALDRAMILKAMESPIIASAVEFVFADKNHKTRAQDIKDGNTDQYEAFKPEFEEYCRKHKLYGMVLSAMICAQLGVDDPRDIVKVIEQASEDKEFTILPGLAEYNDDVEHIKSAIENNPEFQAIVSKIKEMDPTAQLSFDNLYSGLDLESSKIVKLGKEYEAQLKKLDQFLGTALDANKAAQETLGAARNGRFTMSAYFKEGRLKQSTVRMEDLYAKYVGAPKREVSELMVKLIDKTGEIRSAEKELFQKDVDQIKG